MVAEFLLVLVAFPILVLELEQHQQHTDIFFAFITKITVKYKYKMAAF